MPPVSSLKAALDRACTSTLARISNPNTRAMYGKALLDFVHWWNREGCGQILTEPVVQAHKTFLLDHGYSASSVNQRLTAIRRLVSRAAEVGLLDLEQAMAIQRVKGAPKASARTYLLTERQAEELMNAPDATTLKGQRDRALLALLVGCGLRRNEVVLLNVDDLEREDGGWGLLSVNGNKGKCRAVPLPPWVRHAIEKWLTVSQVNEGAMFRAVGRDGGVRMQRLSAPMLGEIVRAYGKIIGQRISPRNLRRTCAVLCRRRGADLEQIQMLLGHSSIQMTEQIMGSLPKPTRAPNGRLGLRWRKAKKLAS